MKTKEEILQMLFARLTEIQSGVLDETPNLKKMKVTELSILSDILGDDIPYEYWDSIEEEILTVD